MVPHQGRRGDGLRDHAPRGRGLDTGRTCLTSGRRSPPDETGSSSSFASARARRGVSLIETPRAAAAPEPERQDDELADASRRRSTRTTGRIDWIAPAKQIHDLVRGTNPCPVPSRRSAASASRSTARESSKRRRAGAFLDGRVVATGDERSSSSRSSSPGKKAPARSRSRERRAHLRRGSDSADPQEVSDGAVLRRRASREARLVASVDPLRRLLRGSGERSRSVRARTGSTATRWTALRAEPDDRRPLIVRAARKVTRCRLDVHLMIVELREVHRRLSATRAPTGSPCTPRSVPASRSHACTRIRSSAPRLASRSTRTRRLRSLDYVLDDLDLVLVMSVNPGSADKSLIEHAFPKIERLRKGRSIARGLAHARGGRWRHQAGRTRRASPPRGAHVPVSGSGAFWREGSRGRDRVALRG